MFLWISVHRVSHTGTCSNYLIWSSVRCASEGVCSWMGPTTCLSKQHKHGKINCKCRMGESNVLPAVMLMNQEIVYVHDSCTGDEYSKPRLLFWRVAGIEVAGILSCFLLHEQMWTDRFNFVERKICHVSAKFKVLSPRCMFLLLCLCSLDEQWKYIDRKSTRE